PHGAGVIRADGCGFAHGNPPRCNLLPEWYFAGMTTTAKTRFAFGENWASFAETITEQRIQAAIAGLRRLFPNGELAGKAFLDIGCGSGLSMLAALRLGASRVTGIDI